MRRLLVIAAVLLLGVSSSQVITRGYIYSNIGTLYTWSGTAQTAWNGSLQSATEGDFCTYVKNNGCAGESSLRDITSGQASSWAVNTSSHSPILTNASFQSACGSWTLAGVSGTGLAATVPTCPTSGDQDADGYYSLLTTATGTTCSALNATTTCEGSTAQTFSIAGTPTSQSLSFYYKGSVTAASGDSVNCSPTNGSVGLAVKVNATTVTLGTLTFDGTWRQWSGSISSLVNGSNSITFTQSGQTTVNQPSHYNATTQTYTCSTTYAANTISVDNVILTATY